MEFIKKNARMLAVAVVLVGGITVISFSGDNNNQQVEPENSVTETSQQEQNEQTNNVQPEVEIGSQPTAGPVQIQEDKSSYVSTVRKNDNQTVIVRQMVNNFLADESKNLSVEKRLFVETKVVDSLPRTDIILVGDEIEVAKSVIASAVGESDSLTEYQLSLWSAYL